MVERRERKKDIEERERGEGVIGAQTTAGEQQEDSRRTAGGQQEDSTWVYLYSRVRSSSAMVRVLRSTSSRFLSPSREDTSSWPSKTHVSRDSFSALTNSTYREN